MRAMAQEQTAAKQQESSSTQSVPTYTLSVTSRLVPLDVVVTDKKGRPIHGLKKEAFHIKEDGVLQPISRFEEHSAVAAKSVLPPLPPGEHTNFPLTAVNDSETVLLLDSLNTKLADQAFVHQQIIQFLKTLPPGNRVAIFTLASKLRLLQSFTDDPAILMAVLKNKKMLPKGSAVAGDNELSSDSRATLSMDDPSLGNVSTLGDFDADFQTFQDQQRQLITQQAMQEIGEYLVGIPGRKNLVWFAGNFPIGLSAQPTGSDPTNLELTQDAADQRDLIDLYIRARISVYPVSAGGLQVDSFTSASQSNRSFAANQTAITTASISAANNRANERIPMEKLAEDTGGKAFFDTNGLKQAIDTALSDGNNYYTVDYTPSDHEFDKQFHKITVSVDGDYKLSYRSGYYSDGPTGVTNSVPGLTPGYTFADAMVRGTPNATSIIFKVRVEPAERPAGSPLIGDSTGNLKGKTFRYAIDYATSMRAMAIAKAPDGTRQAAITVGVVAYDLDGKVLNSNTKDLKLDLKPQTFADAVRSGLKFEQLIDLPDQPLFLKIGIYDPASGNIGTMEVPVKPVAPVPQTPQPAAGASK
jgi:VWFA-related protein